MYVIYEVKKGEIKSGESLCVWHKKNIWSVCFYGSRQMYFCSENISIEMQKELAYTPPLSEREKKFNLLSKGLKNM